MFGHTWLPKYHIPERVGEESTFSYSLFEHRVCPVHMNTYFTLETENTYLKTDILQYK